MLGQRRAPPPAGFQTASENNWYRTKSRHWEYEEELRLFITLADATKELELYFWPFSDDMRLVEVILGARCDLSLSDVRSLAAATTPTAFVYRARLARRSFDIVPDGRTTKRLRTGEAA